MAATDAKAVPVKNSAYRVTFPIFDADGDLVTGATGLDSEVSIDGGTFADCTNEATEIATNSGMYYLDLTSGEMNGDTIAVIVKTSSSGAKTTPIVLYTAARSINDLAYPTTSGRSIDVTAGGEVGIDWANVGSPTTTVNFSGTTIKTATDVETDTADIQTRLPAALVGGRIDANVGAISGDATAADNAESFFDGTGYAGTNNIIPVVTTVNGLANGTITAAVVATGAIDADALATDAVSEITAAIEALVLETGLTWKNALRLIVSATAGKASGLATATAVYRNAVADDKNRISATVDADGNRTAITYDLT